MVEKLFKDFSDGKINYPLVRRNIKTILKFADNLDDDQKFHFNELVGSTCYYFLKSAFEKDNTSDEENFSIKALPELVTEDNYDAVLRNLIDFRDNTKRKRNKLGTSAANLVTLTVMLLHPKHTQSTDVTAAHLAAQICDAQMQKYRAQL